MSFLLSCLNAVYAIYEWFKGSDQKALGKAEQENADDKETIKKLEAEKDVAAQRVDALEQLRDGKL